MQDYKASILVTREVESSWVSKAAEAGILLDVIPFIKTEPVLTVEVQQEIEQAATQYATVVFTSSAAVQAVTELLDGDKPEWRIYCIGYHTKETASRYFGEAAIAGSAPNAALLAEAILEEEATEELFFFAGNQRRHELPDTLRSAGIEVIEITVYQTALIPRQTGKKYDGVLFFSPSAVESYYIKNKMAEQSIAFAIGKTTADTVARYFPNKVLTSEQPVKEALVQMAIHYFS